MKRYLIIMLLFSAISQGVAQTSNTHEETLREIIREMKNLKKVEKGGYYLMDIQLKMTPKTTRYYANMQVEAKDVRLKMILGQEYLLYETEFLSVYQDGKDNFQVFHPDKLILRKPVPPGTFEQYNQLLSNSSQLNDELFDAGRLIDVQDEVINGVSVKKLVYRISRIGAEKYGIQTTAYWYNPQTKKLVKQHSTFVDKHPMQTQEVVYHQLDANYKGRFPRTAKSAVLDKSAALLPKYSQYKLETTE